LKEIEKKISDLGKKIDGVCEDCDKRLKQLETDGVGDLASVGTGVGTAFSTACQHIVCCNYWM